MHTTNTQCVLYIKAGAATASMAGALHWPVRPVRGLYGPHKNSVLSRNLSI